jgi:hypothetical protein
MLIMPTLILVIGLFSAWTGWGGLRAQRPVLGWFMLAAAVAFVGVAIFLFWALLKVSNLASLGP